MDKILKCERAKIEGLSGSSRVCNLQFAICNSQFATFFFCSIIFFILPSPLLCADAPIAVPVEGRLFSAELTSIDVKGQVSFQSAGQKRQLALADLVAWGACLETKRTPILALADGGLLVADVLSSDKETLPAESDIFGRLKIPLDALAGVIFRLPPALKDRDALFDRIARAQGDSDRLLLDNGDELTGLVEKIKEDAVKLNTNVGSVNIDLGRVTAIIFNPALRRKIPNDSTRTWLGFSDGSRLPATDVRLDSSKMQFAVAGQTLTTVPKNLVFLQPLSGRAVYLSDLKPSDYRFVPFLDLTWPYHLDRSVTGAWLRAGGVSYLKGIGLHSAARLTYTLDQPYQRFQAELAIDDSAAGGGSVRFRVFVDGREKFASDTIRGGMKAVLISVDLSGAKQIDLVVDYADRADVLDHADWLNARLIK
jgi:hypothetical protein